MKNVAILMMLCSGTGLALSPVSVTTNIGTSAALSGQFRSLGAPTTGQVSIVKSGKNYALKISGLKTQPAPDLKVWLYKGDLEGASKNVEVSGKYLTLGTVKRFNGDFTFTIVDNDISKYSSVVLWCNQVKTAFAIAPLSP